VVEFPDTVQLARPRSGHFDLGTGYHGDLWLDLDALLLRPSLLRAQVRWLAARLTEHSVDAVCGPLEGGAFLAYAVADLLGVAFLPGYRRPGERVRYHLPAVPGGIDGWRVGVVDDAVNAGTAVVACLEELRGRGAVPVAVATLVSLGEASTMVQARMGVPFYPASTVPSRTWPAERCPLCAEGAPYTDPLSGDVVSPLPGRGTRFTLLMALTSPGLHELRLQMIRNRLMSLGRTVTPRSVRFDCDRGCLPSGTWVPGAGRRT